ncbi:MAG: hypothetical protein LAO06_04655 [Acidobacteriia bacterium]|nr:hypothetical protein [Terriglobia bacterium]
MTFTCYRRAPQLSSPAARELFEPTLERVRRWYGFCVSGHVVMPEHVHLLLSEPERAELSVALQMVKQIAGGPPFRPVLAKGGRAKCAPRCHSQAIFRRGKLCRHALASAALSARRTPSLRDLHLLSSRAAFDNLIWPTCDHFIWPTSGP